VFLKGNHEAFLAEVFSRSYPQTTGSSLAGCKPLMSYGLSPSPIRDDEEQRALVQEFAAAMPPQHLEFLQRLRVTFTCGDFFFVHAGVRAGYPVAGEQETDLLWIREEFSAQPKHFGKYIVHGHTPVRSAEVLANRANIDTGAYATGNLTCCRSRADACWRYDFDLSPVSADQHRPVGNSDHPIAFRARQRRQPLSCLR